MIRTYFEYAKLVYNDETVGIRMISRLHIGNMRKPIVAFDLGVSGEEEYTKSLSYIINKLSGISFESGFPKRMFLSDDGTRLISSEDRFYEVREVETLKCMINEINKTYNKCIKKVKELLYKMPELKILMNMFLRDLRREVSVPRDSDCVRVEDMCIEIRFLGGYDAWSGDEDICDADILSPKIGKKVSSFVKGYCKNKGYKDFKIEFSTSEKAWSYFEFGFANIK